MMRYPRLVHDMACRDFRQLGLSRRETMRAGALALTGLGLPDLLRAKPLGSNSGPNGFGRAKSCILIFMWGGPSQLDTWDPKPDAPDGYPRAVSADRDRTCRAISISEHFPMLAQQAHRLAIVRSMSHDDPAHLSTAHRILTGHLAPTPYSDAAGPSPRDWPHLGALVCEAPADGRGDAPARSTCPGRSCIRPRPAARRPARTPAGWARRTTRSTSTAIPNAADFHVEGLGLPDGISADRLGDRRALLRPDRPTRPDLSGDGPQLLGRLSAASARRARLGRGAGAFEIDREDPQLRDRYGRNIHGQCLLLARRLIEAGVGLVTVNWHDDGQNFWDTHGDNFNQLKNRLMPPADQGFSALLDDLDVAGPARRDAGRLGRRVRPHAAHHPGQHRPRALAALLLGRPGRRRRARRLGLRRLRPLGRLSGPRSGQPRRPRRDHPARPRHRPRHDGQRRRRSPPADQRRHAHCAAIWLKVLIVGLACDSTVFVQSRSHVPTLQVSMKLA